MDQIQAALARKRKSDPNAPTIAEALPYDRWLSKNFPSIATAPLSKRHLRLWSFFDKLTPGAKPTPLVEIWPRGGAKSSTAELATAFIGEKLTRRFVLYVSATQDQANDHVQNIGDLLEEIGVGRAHGQYGQAKGWSKKRLRCANGFNVVAFGLDGKSRGIKLDRHRPDLIILDDIDNEDDTPETIAKKESKIKTKILPTGSPDCGVLFIQNLIHEDSIAAKMSNGSADFLLNRVCHEPEPAVLGLKYKPVLLENGVTGYEITDGTPTWPGQSIETCEAQILEWGLPAFLREAQHEVFGKDGYFFLTSAFGDYIDPAEAELIQFTKICRAWDLAATEGGGDYTVGVLMGLAPNKVTFVLDVVRGQYASNNVRKLLVNTAKADREKWGKKCKVRLPLDPGQAGKWQELQLNELLTGFDPIIVPVTGKKAIRARGWANKVNEGNARIVKGEWNKAFKWEHREFKEDETHLQDDQVDAASDSYNELETPGGSWATDPEGMKRLREAMAAQKGRN